MLMTERTPLQPGSLSEVGTLISGRESGQIRPNGHGKEGQLAPNGFDFLDFHHPQLKARALELGFENGRVFIDRKLYSFLVSAKEAGAVGAVISKMDSVHARKVLEIAWFLTCTDATYSELGNEYSYRARGEPRSLAVSFVRQVYRNCPEDIKEEYPLDDLSLVRARTQRHYDKRSEVLGGKRAAIRQLVESGESDFRRLAAETGVSEYKVVNLLVSFRKQGLLPVSKKELGRRVRTLIPDASTSEEYWAILNTVPPNTLVSNDNFISLSRFLRNHGYIVRSRDVRRIVNLLISQNIPFRQLANVGDNPRVKSRGTFVMRKQEPDVLAAVNGSVVAIRILKRA